VSKNLFAAFAAFQSEVRDPVKDASNPHFRSRYADLHGVLAAVRPVLAKHGLAITQTINVRDGQVHPLLETMLLHTSGESISSTVPLAVTKAGPQEFGSVMSYLRRYSLMALLGIAGADDDDDGEAATPRGKTPAVTSKATQDAAQFDLVEEATSAMAAAKSTADLVALAARCRQFTGADKETVAAAYRARQAALGGAK
jgi:hypothetical protein